MACTDGGGPAPAKVSGNTAASFRAKPSQSVDWRRSARDDHLYVREQEWEAAHTVWLWPDRSPSMAFASRQSRDSKLERGLIVTFALAELLVAGGERVGIPGLMSPTASRSVIDKMAQAMLHDDAARLSLPPSFVPSALAEIVVLSDSGRRSTKSEPCSPDYRHPGRTARWSRSSIRQKKVSPIPVVSSSSNRKAVVLSPRAARKNGPSITLPASLFIVTRFAAKPTSSTGCYSTHTTSRSAAELLLFLHSGMMVSKGSARTATVKAGRSA